MGKLIVIEGSCDGVGKSTQYKLLMDRLISDNENTIVTHHFPSYGTYQGRPVEDYLQNMVIVLISYHNFPLNILILVFLDMFHN